VWDHVVWKYRRRLIVAMMMMSINVGTWLRVCHKKGKKKLQINEEGETATQVANIIYNHIP
jgi:hypothetical protein